MIKNLNIDEKLEKYISEHSYRLHPVQEEIIEYNNTLGNSKKCKFPLPKPIFFNS